MTKFSLIYIIWMVTMAFVTLLLLPYAIDIFGILFLKKGVPIMTQLSLFQWCAVGFVGYCIFHNYVHLNIKWLETDSHEKIHGAVGWFFGRRIHSSYSEEGSGVIYTSGGNLWNRIGMIPMALAPYCLPLWTLILLPIRHLVDFHGRWIFDIIIGVSIGFHVLCYKDQTGKHQTDINQYPLSFSYFYIYLARLINALVIIVSFFPQTQKEGVLYPVTRMVGAMWKTLCDYLDVII